MPFVPIVPVVPIPGVPRQECVGATGTIGTTGTFSKFSQRLGFDVADILLECHGFSLNLVQFGEVAFAFQPNFTIARPFFSEQHIQ